MIKQTLSQLRQPKIKTALTLALQTQLEQPGTDEDLAFTERCNY